MRSVAGKPGKQRVCHLDCSGRGLIRRCITGSRGQGQRVPWEEYLVTGGISIFKGSSGDQTRESNHVRHALQSLYHMQQRIFVINDFNRTWKSN